MLLDDIIDLLKSELNFAESKHNEWPTDPIHASAILAEEAGELTQACLDWSYSNGCEQLAINEAIQCGAMAIRFLKHIGRYEPKKALQV